MKRPINPSHALLAGLALLGMITGCTHMQELIRPKPKEPAVVEVEPGPGILESEQLSEDHPSAIVHTVRWRGETLSIIAKWYTGDPGNWKALANANPELDPNLIRLGDKILIPPELSITDEPLPQSFVGPIASKEKARSASSKLLPEASEDMELFGPK